jgi:hypothetical protein
MGRPAIDTVARHAASIRNDVDAIAPPIEPRYQAALVGRFVTRLT